LAELYLNYAEAANEAYGPNTAAPGAAMTAVEAINHIRQRVNMPPVLAEFTGDKDIFRDRIKNERTIELAFEGHYFYDIRRWEDAPEIYSGTMWGMDIEKVTVSPTFPTGYRYTRKKLPDNRQIAWRADGAMYYFPLRQADYEMFKNFEKYPVW
jgi:hypothetical protein